MNNQNTRYSKFIGMCFNWKGFTAVAILGAGLFILFPDRTLALAPLLILALCPLSMLFMMGTMRDGDAESKNKDI